MIDLRSISSILYFAGIITLVTSVFIAYWSFRYKAGQIPNASFKDVQPINGSYIESVEEVCRVPTHETCKKLIAWTVEAVKHNEKKNHEKAKLISTTWRLMIVGLVMVTAFVLLSIFFLRLTHLKQQCKHAYVEEIHQDSSITAGPHSVAENCNSVRWMETR